MLRGRWSCAISGPPGTSSRDETPLTPLFPLHPRKPPVSALFPLLTQKQGVGSILCFLYFLYLLCFHYFLPTRHSPLSLTIPVHPRGSSVSPIIPVHTQKQGVGAFPPNVFTYNSFVFFGHVNYSVKYNCRRADIPILARSTNVAREAGTRHENRDDEEKGGAL